MDLFATLTRTGSTGTVELRRHYATTAPDLWAACTDPERLARWFAPVKGDLREGGRYEVVFDEANDAARVWGVVERCDAPHRLSLSWEAPDDHGPSSVVVTLSPAGEGTDLVLVHTGLPDGSDIGHAAGWEVYARFLAADVDGTDAGDWGEQWQAFRDAHAARIA